ncbi:MAG: hypothetical protein HZA91_17610 [Verrucomicrobia bacterium]|nr:hypothetical protein [Verrucomicrobiota bacterium]
MSKVQWLAILGLAGLVAATPPARAQSRPYVAYVYPAGGQQGATFEIKAAGQDLNGVNDVIVSGSGVTAKFVECCFPLDGNVSRLLSRQLDELKRSRAKAASKKKTQKEAASSAAPGNDPATTEMMAKIEKLLYEDVRFPVCAAFRGVAFIEVTIASNAPPGERELRLVTWRGGVSNPMVFHVGQVPEHSRQPMRTAPRQILGREALALRNRPASEAEERIHIPCTVNGQIASGEVNSYRFTARKGQRLVITTQARQLIPYIADGVPGWFQPVLVLYDTNGKEVAYDDDYRFKPDPVILYEVPKDGEYVFEIHDAIYRGRNDFVYRITIGEQPFVTSIFPLGARAGEPVALKMKGWNLDGAEIAPPARDAAAGVHQVVANRKGFVSNPVPFALDTLPESLEKEANNTPARAQKVTLPLIINGRIDKADDWDVFQFSGKAGDTVVAEVHARRLDSPMDSEIKLTDATGRLLAFSDDREDLGAGVNTHHADSYFMAKLPADGTYYVHIGDTGRKGGAEYGYRLRISAPRPDFALRVVPSSASVRGKGDTSLNIFAVRKDGFAGDIKLDLKNPPAGFTSIPSLLTRTQAMGRIRFKTNLAATNDPVNLSIAGSARTGETVIVREAVPAEDRMQAFLWRHLVPAQDLKVLVFDPKYTPPPSLRRVPPELTPAQLAKAEAVVAAAEAKGRKFTKSQVDGLARQIKALYEKGLLTDGFYGDRIAELGHAR